MLMNVNKLGCASVKLLVWLEFTKALSLSKPINVVVLVVVIVIVLVKKKLGPKNVGQDIFDPKKKTTKIWTYFQIIGR